MHSTLNSSATQSCGASLNPGPVCTMTPHEVASYMKFLGVCQSSVSWYTRYTSVGLCQVNLQTVDAFQGTWLSSGFSPLLLLYNYTILASHWKNDFSMILPTSWGG